MTRLRSAPLPCKGFASASLAILGAAVVLGCGSDTPLPGPNAELEVARVEARAAISPSEFRPGRILLSAVDETAPVECAADDVLNRVVTLFDSFSLGEPDVGSQFVTEPDRALRGWFQITTPTPPDTTAFLATAPDSLDAYFAERSRQGETFRIAALQVGPAIEDEVIGFVPHVYRSASDLPAGEHLYFGKGSLHCASGKFVVLSLAPGALAQVQEP